MTKLSGLFLTLTQTFMVASAVAVAVAVALSMWSSPALAQNDVRTSSEGGDTFVKRTYDDKTGKLLEIVKDTETRDPNDRTKILRKVTTKKYNQGKRPYYAKTVDEQEIVVVDRKRVLRKHTKTSTIYTKSKNRDPVSEIKEEKELFGLDANGVPIYTGTRVTTRWKGDFPEQNEVWNVTTRRWVPVRRGLDRFLEEQRKQLLDAQRQKSLNRSKTTKKDLKKNKDKPEETNTARREDGSAGRTPAKQAPTALACDALGGEWRGGTLEKVKQIATDWKKEISIPCLSGTPEMCRRSLGGSSFQAYMKTLMIWQCHALFVMLSKKGSDEDRKLAREEGCAIEKTLEKMAEHIKASGFWAAGASWKPLHVSMSEKWELKDLCDTGKIEEAGSGSRKDPKITAPPVAEAKPPTSASSTDGKTGITTTSVKNADGTRTVTKTDKNGKVISEKIVGKSPASASSTDIKTGITTKSVKNPDGTRTVTKTDKNGNVLSRETVGNSPDSASSTDLKTNVTVKSVANPDGTHTVTTTSKDGTVLSVEKVR